MASRLASILVLVIVAATLIAGLIAGAQNESNGPVDLIVLNGRVYTGAGNTDIEEAVAVRGNQILKVGSNREIRRLTRAQTTVIDARGGTVVPGFVDTHADLIGTGLEHERLTLEGVDTIEDIDRAIAAYAAAHPDRAWIEATGWDMTLYDKLPSRQQLDTLVPDRPAYVISADSHVMWANTPALDAARIARRTANPSEGVIVKDRRTGEPTGILKGSAQALVTGAVPAVSPEERERAIEEAQRIAHEAGVTSVHNAPTSLADLQILARLRRSGEMAVRVYQLLHGAVDMRPGDLPALQNVRREYPEVPLFKIGAVRIVLAAPDTDAGRDKTAEAVAARIAELDRDGWQVVVSAADAASVEAAALAFDRVPENGDGQPRRHRIETPDMPDADLVARLAKTGVTVSLVPAESLDPLEIIVAAAAQADPAALAQVLRETIDRFTSAAATASLDEQRKGTLAPGMLADFVILSDDLFATPQGELSAVKVNVTVFDGKVVYDRSVAAPTMH
jgi:predicted amidohydrolase YtcJ